MGNFDEYLMWQQIAFMQKHSRYGILPLQSIKTQMGDENMEKRKFKVGDRVRCKRDGWIAAGTEGTIVDIRIDYVGDPQPYHVDFGEHMVTFWMREDNLELVEEKEMTGFELVMGKHVVETKEGSFYLLVKKDEERIISLNLDDPEEWVDFALDENLHDVEDNNFDIEKVYEYRRCGFSSIKNNLTSPVWERKHVKEMTIAEIEKELGYAIKVVKEEK